MDAEKVIGQIIEEKKKVEEVYWVACGGSLIDLYPAHCMLEQMSKTITSQWTTSREFVLKTPVRMGKNSLVVLCSHSGGTKETFDAALKAWQAGAAVVMFTHVAGSLCDDERFISWVYPWEDDTSISKVPTGITLLLAAELIRRSEGSFYKYHELYTAVEQMDGILAEAKKKVRRELGEEFAQRCGQYPFFYILGSGPNFSQAYGFAICSLMEMQWQHCAYIHSGEYFHGPFEVTENGVFYFLQMGSGICRDMDERALAFLKTHTDAVMVLDALGYGMDQIDRELRDYLDPILFYAMNVELRAARGKKFDHDPSVRRYMGIERY